MTLSERVEAVYQMGKDLAISVNGKPLTKADAKALIEAEDTRNEEALLKGDSVKTSYGTIKVVHRKERKGRNPKTQEEVMIPAKDTLKISVNSEFGSKLNNK
jgi:DNA-binding protein HU-beta